MSEALSAEREAEIRRWHTSTAVPAYCSACVDLLAEIDRMRELISDPAWTRNKQREATRRLQADLAAERRVRKLLAEALNGWLTTDLPIPLRLLQETSRALAESGALDQKGDA